MVQARIVGDREHEPVPICGNEDALVEPGGFPTCVPVPRCRGQVKQRESIRARGSCEQRGLGPVMTPPSTAIS
jgi:hypothetical protein